MRCIYTWVASDETHRDHGRFEGNMNILDVQTQSVVSKWHAHSEIKSFGISENGEKVWTWGSSKPLPTSSCMKLWDLSCQTQELEFDLPLIHGSICIAVECIDVSPGKQKLLCGYTNGKICLWELRSKNAVWERQYAHEGYVRCVKLMPDATSFFSGGNDHAIRKWTDGSREAIMAFSGHTLAVCCLATSKDHCRMVSGSYDKTLRVWHQETGTSISLLKGHEGLVFSVSTSMDCKRVASGSSDMTVRVWDVESKSQIAVMRGHASPVLGVCLFPNGESVVSCSGDGTLRVWDVRVAEKLQEYSTRSENWHDDVVLSVAISGNGKFAVSGSADKTLRMWDTLSGKQLGDPLQVQSSQVSSTSISHDGKRVCCACGPNFCVWDVAKKHRFISLPYQCSAIGVSPNGGRAVVAMSCADGTSMSMRGVLRLWNLPPNLDNIPQVDNGMLIEGMNDYVLRAYISTDGKRAVCCSYDQVRVWEVQTRFLLLDIGRNRGQGSQAVNTESESLQEATTMESVISQHEVFHAVGESGRVPHVHCSGKKIFWVNEERTLVGLLDTRCSDYSYNSKRKVVCIGTENGKVLFCKAIDSGVEDGSLTKRRKCVIS